MKSLFQETRIKTLTLPNRFVRSATWMAMAAPDGRCTERVFNCYETLAGGEIGLIITGFAVVSQEGQGPVGQLGIYSDHHVDGLRELTRKVHARGGRIAAQIVHCGNAGNPENNGGSEVIGPSDRFDDKGKQIARAMTRDEIKRTVEAFGASAVRALDSGFDAIQLHFAHGYLGSQFLSPRHNRRDDDYGGSAQNRRRFLQEVYDTVRGITGDSYPVMAKLNIEDFLDDGLMRDEGMEAAAMLRDAGLDALEVSGGTAESGKLGPARRIKGEDEEAYFKDNASAVKQAAGKMPVMLVGGLRTPLKMMQIHRATGIDYFSLSRPFIREPHLVKRWKSGKTHPADCVSCSGCFLSIKYGIGVHCLKLRKKEKE